MPINKFMSAEDAVALIKDGDTVALPGGGGGLVEPSCLFAAVEKRFLSEGHPRNLWVVHALGIGDRKTRGMNCFAHEGMVRRVIGGHWVWSPRMQQLARDEKIEVKLGEAFDVVADRKQMEWRALGGCSSESAWTIALRNHKDEAVKVSVIEPANGDWEILSSSHPAKKEDAQTFVFEVDVPSRGETKVSYKIRVRWC